MSTPLIASVNVFAETGSACPEPRERQEEFYYFDKPRGSGLGTFDLESRDGSVIKFSLRPACEDIVRATGLVGSLEHAAHALRQLVQCSPYENGDGLFARTATKICGMMMPAHRGACLEHLRQLKPIPNLQRPWFEQHVQGPLSEGFGETPAACNGPVGTPRLASIPDSLNPEEVPAGSAASPTTPLAL